MKMKTDDYRILLSELQMDVLPVCAPQIVNPNPMQVTLADAWEIRNLDKNMIKKLRKEEILALIAYGQDYTKQYQEGRFLYKKGRNRPMADFDEAAAYDDILLIISMLKAELNHK